METTEHFGIYFGYIRRLFQRRVSPFKEHVHRCIVQNVVAFKDSVLYAPFTSGTRGGGQPGHAPPKAQEGGIVIWPPNSYNFFFESEFGPI